jgi:hypothetical protein
MIRRKTIIWRLRTKAGKLLCEDPTITPCCPAASVKGQTTGPDGTGRM